MFCHVMMRALVLSLVVATCAAKGSKPHDVPNPFDHWSGCGRTEPGYVCDQYSYLRGSFSALDEKISSIKVPGPEMPEPCAGIAGYEGGIAIVKSMYWDSYFDEVESMVLGFAQKVYDYWGIGDDSCGNGYLILLSIEDRAVAIHRGASASARLTDSRLVRIIDNMKFLLRNGNYEDALLGALVEIDGYLKAPKPSFFFTKLITAIVYASILGFIGWVVWEIIKESNKTAERDRAVRRLENDLEKLERNEYEVTDCPVCLQELQFGTQERNVERREIREWDNDSRKFALQAAKAGYQSVKTALGLAKEKIDRPAFALECGHIYCEPCIRRALQSEPKCPVCRQDVGGELTQIDSRRDVRPLDRSMHQREMDYRLRRINRYYAHGYPYRMARPKAYGGDTQEGYRARHAHLVRDQPKPRQSTRTGYSGGGNRSSSGPWGGGGGGGGRGGRW